MTACRKQLWIVALFTSVAFFLINWIPYAAKLVNAPIPSVVEEFLIKTFVSQPEYFSDEGITFFNIYSKECHVRVFDKYLLTDRIVIGDDFIIDYYREFHSARRIIARLTSSRNFSIKGDLSSLQNIYDNHLILERKINRIKIFHIYDSPFEPNNLRTDDGLIFPVTYILASDMELQIIGEDLESIQWMLSGCAEVLEDPEKRTNLEFPK